MIYKVIGEDKKKKTQNHHKALMIIFKKNGWNKFNNIKKIIRNNQNISYEQFKITNLVDSSSLILAKI